MVREIRVEEKEVTWADIDRLYDFEHRAMASGGYGAIHTGKRRDTGEAVVLKHVNVNICAVKKFRHLSVAGCDEIRKYILREWQALSQLAHPNIVSAKDDILYHLRDPCSCGGDHSDFPDGASSDGHHRDDIYVLVMERMQIDLFDLMHYWRGYRKSPTKLKLTSFGQLIYSRLPPKLARRIFYHIAKALDFLHEKPVLHRDISWGNIMMKNDETGKMVAKLVDLGLSRNLPSSSGAISIEGIGTVAFCAPELLSSEFKTTGYGTRVDVWSLGIVLYLMLTGNCDKNERSLRFREVMDALDLDHRSCIEARRGGGNRRCNFCAELLNERFQENVTNDDLAMKRQALSLLEGMLVLVPENRMSIKQVLRHDWLEAERAADPLYNAMDTEEEAVLLSIPRPHGLTPVSVRASKMEYSYMNEPQAAVVVSSYRRSAKTVNLGDSTSFGGVLSRLGISTGERMLQSLVGGPGHEGALVFQPGDYLISLDDCVPERSRHKYFQHLFLSLLDHPNDLRSVLSLYKALRGVDLRDAKGLITPLLGFSFDMGKHTPYHYRLREDSKKTFIFQQFLSLAFHLASSSSSPAIEVITLQSWKSATFKLVKDVCLGPRPLLPPQILMDGPVNTNHLHQLLEEITPLLPLIKDTIANIGTAAGHGYGYSDDDGNTTVASLQVQLIDAVKALRYGGQGEGGADPKVLASLEARVCSLCGLLGQRLLSQAMELEGWRWRGQQDSPKQGQLSPCPPASPIEQGSSGASTDLLREDVSISSTTTTTITALTSAPGMADRRTSSSSSSGVHVPPQVLPEEVWLALLTLESNRTKLVLPPPPPTSTPIPVTGGCSGGEGVEGAGSVGGGGMRGVRPIVAPEGVALVNRVDVWCSLESLRRVLTSLTPTPSTSTAPHHHHQQQEQESGGPIPMQLSM